MSTKTHTPFIDLNDPETTLIWPYLPHFEKEDTYTENSEFISTVVSLRTQAITAVLSYLHVSGDDILISMFDRHHAPIVVLDAAGGGLAAANLCGAKDSLLEVNLHHIFTPSMESSTIHISRCITLPMTDVP